MRARVVGVVMLCLVPAIAPGQSSEVRFGGLQQDPGAPVEVTSDSLTLDQDAGSAVFTGNVIVIQGDLRLSAGTVDVRYTEGGGDIDSLVATGGVTLVSPEEAAEAERAEYDPATGKIVLSGDVLLTQGQSILSSSSMIVDLEAGTAVLEGRVRTVLRQGNN